MTKLLKLDQLYNLKKKKTAFDFKDLKKIKNYAMESKKKMHNQIYRISRDSYKTYSWSKLYYIAYKLQKNISKTRDFIIANS